MYILLTLYLYVFYLSENEQRLTLTHLHSHLQLIGFYNLEEKCLLLGTNWVFKKKQSALRLWRFIMVITSHFYQTQEPKDRTPHSCNEFPYDSASSVTPSASTKCSVRAIDHYTAISLGFTEEKTRNICAV